MKEPYDSQVPGRRITPNVEMVQVPLYMLKIITDYAQLEPKEISQLPTKVRMALDDLTNYIKEKS